MVQAALAYGHNPIIRLPPTCASTLPSFPVHLVATFFPLSPPPEMWRSYFTPIFFSTHIIGSPVFPPSSPSEFIPLPNSPSLIGAVRGVEFRPVACLLYSFLEYTFAFLLLFVALNEQPQSFKLSFSFPGL